MVPLEWHRAPAGRDDFTGGEHLDLKLVVGHFGDVFGELRGAAIDRVERLRETRGHAPFDLGEDCAIAGEATAATAAPLAETFKKSRRFI